MLKQDKFLIGFLSGLLAPFIGFYLYYFSFFRIMSISKFFNHLQETSTLAAIISLSLLANLALFFLFDKFGRLRCQQGVIGATFIYGFYIVYLKLF
jgi:hypothetical protein